MEQDLLQKIVSLCKRRGFVFQSSEIYGGLKSAYDYGPLGVELKRNIADCWWRSMVTTREDIVGLDAAIFMHPKVWQASGHLATFSDPLVDCLNCKERFRADKAPKAPVGTEAKFRKGGKGDGQWAAGVVKDKGIICPVCGSPDLSPERQFNLMFRTSHGPVDPFEGFIEEVQGKALSREELRAKLEDAAASSAVYLRPETAQAMFVQFLNVQQSMSLKVPFGIAQIGKSFRNEIITEKFIFRTCEFEQMEMEYFVEPGTNPEWHEYWLKERLAWWQRLTNNSDSFQVRAHTREELSHYSDATYDLEFKFPWGFDELEGIASRTKYDLTQHATNSGVKLSYFDQQKNDPDTGKPGWRYVPYVIEPALGLTRAFLAILCDAYHEEEGLDAEGEGKTRIVLKLKPILAPIKAAILPLVKKDGLPEIGRKIVADFLSAGITVRYDEQQSIGKRYARHDEIGTPFCLTIDHQTAQDETVTIRDRDTTKQERVKIDQALAVVKERLAAI